MLGGNERDREGGAPSRRDELAGRHARDERRVAAWIGASIVIKGDLTSSEDMTIAGEVEGDVAVRQNTLVIAPQGRIRGNVVARAVAVHGEVLGSITAEQRVEVGESGSVEGDIATPRLAVAEGATLHGRVGSARTSPALA